MTFTKFANIMMCMIWFTLLLKLSQEENEGGVGYYTPSQTLGGLYFKLI